MSRFLVRNDRGFERTESLLHAADAGLIVGSKHSRRTDEHKLAIFHNAFRVDRCSRECGTTQCVFEPIQRLGQNTSLLFVDLSFAETAVLRCEFRFVK